MSRQWGPLSPAAGSLQPQGKDQGQHPMAAVLHHAQSGQDSAVWIANSLKEQNKTKKGQTGELLADD